MDRDTMLLQIKSDLYKRQGHAHSPNFKETLPSTRKSNLAATGDKRSLSF